MRRRSGVLLPAPSLCPRHALASFIGGFSRIDERIDGVNGFLGRQELERHMTGSTAGGKTDLQRASADGREKGSGAFWGPPTVARGASLRELPNRFGHPLLRAIRPTTASSLKKKGS
jgi:hypothetical protein